MNLPENAAVTDQATLERFASATRYVETLRSTPILTPPQKRPTYPSNSQRGWLLNAVYQGQLASVLTGHYNPSYSSYMISQVGLWPFSQAASFTLTVTVSGTSITQSFQNPNTLQLSDAFGFFGLRAYCGNPLQTASHGIETVIGVVDHYFWLLSVPAPEVEWTLTFNDASSLDQTLVGSVVRDTPDGNVLTAFDTMDLEWPLTPGSKVVMNLFPDGWGITSAKQRLLFNS